MAPSSPSEGPSPAGADLAAARRRDLAVLAVSLAVGLAGALATGMSGDPAVAAPAAPWSFLSTVLAFAFLPLAGYTAWRWRRAPSPPAPDVAERLRAALAQARSAEERAESSHRRLIDVIEM